MLKTVFFGTPAVAVPFLERLAGSSRILGVVTAPDAPAGRGYEMTPPPVKTAALALGLPVWQPASLKDFSLKDHLPGAADLGLVVAYGKLLPRAVFSVPKHGLVNVHFSLLPKYRGAAPVQWALIRGEKETGVTLFRIEEGLDTGPVFLQKALAILPEETAPALRERLSAAGLELADELIRSLERGEAAPRPQSGEPTQAPALKKEDGRLRWSVLSGEEAADLVRGTYEWPGAFTLHGGRSLKVHEAHPAPDAPGDPTTGLDPKGGVPPPGRWWGDPGRVLGLERGRGFLVKCRRGTLLVRRVRPEGKKEMSAADFWNGARLAPGDRFEE